MNFNGIVPNNNPQPQGNRHPNARPIPTVQVPPPVAVAAQPNFVLPTKKKIFQGQHYRLDAPSFELREGDLDSDPKLIEFLNDYFQGKLNKEAVFPFLVRQNIFQRLLTNSFFHPYLETLSQKNYIELSMMQNDDFEVSPQQSNLIDSKFNGPMNPVIEEDFFKSNLALYLLVFHRKQYMGINPLNLLRHSETPFTRDQLAAIIQLIDGQVSISYHHAPPYASVNPVFASMTFPPNYTASVEFYILFYGLTNLYKFPIVQSLYKIDSLGKSYNSYLIQKPEIRKNVLKEMEKQYSDRVVRAYETFTFHLELAEAMDDLDKGATDKLYAVLTNMNRLGFNFPALILEKRSLLVKIATSSDSRLQEIFQSGSMNLFMALFRYKVDLGSISPEQVLNLIPFSQISWVPLTVFVEFVQTGVLEKLLPITSVFSKSPGDLTYNTLNRYTAFYKAMSNVNFFDTIIVDEVNELLYRCFLKFLPRTLFHFSLPAGPLERYKNTPLYDEFQRHLNLKKREYRVTMGHFLCNRLQYRTTKLPPLLEFILKDYPDALSWHDSAGRSVLDIAQDHEPLKEWLTKQGLFSNQVLLSPFFQEFIEAADDLDKGATDKMLLVLDKKSKNPGLPIPFKQFSERFLLSKIVRSPDRRLQETIRSGSLRLFMDLYWARNLSDSLNPLEILDIFPSNQFSKATDREIFTFLNTDVLIRLKPLTERFANPNNDLEAITVERFRAFHEGMPIFEMFHANRTFLYENYLKFFPGQLFKLGRVTPNSPLYFEAALQEKRDDYRVTVVHYLCNHVNYTNLAMSTFLTTILHSHPDALDWPDSNGQSVRALAEKYPTLKEWLIKSKLISAPEVAAQPASSFIDYFINLARHVHDSRAKQNKLLQQIRGRLSLLMKEYTSKRSHAEAALTSRGAAFIPIDPNFTYQLKSSAFQLNVCSDLILKLINCHFAGINILIKDLNLPSPPMFDPNSGLFDFARDSLSDRQHREIAGTIYQLKRAELQQFINQNNYELFMARVLDHAKLTELKAIPLLVIREEGDLFHAEILVGRFTQGGHLVWVSPDSSGVMSSKVKDIAGPQVLLSGPDDEDRTAKITVEGMKSLTDYCRNEKGLNLLILPRLDLPEDSEEQPAAPRVVRERQPSEIVEQEDVGEKRNSDLSMPVSKRIRIEPEILPDAIPTTAPEVKGVQSIGGLGTGKHARDFDEMSEPKRVKVDREILPEKMLIPGAPGAKQSREFMKAAAGDPAADLKNLAFMWIHKIVEQVSNISEVSKVLQDGLTLPIEDKLMDLPRMEDVFVFSSLYEYQYADLKRVIQLQKAKIFPLISYRMGLGKTYLYVELLMQQLALNANGIHMMVVPKSVLPQASKDIGKGLLNAKATAWRALWKQNIPLAENTLRAVLNNPKLDESALVSLWPSRHLIKDQDLLNFYLQKVPEVSEEYVIAPNKISARPDQLGGLSRLIRFRSDSIVVVESKPKVSPFVPGRIIVTKYHQVEHLQYDNLDCLTIDEAQKINRKSNNPKKKRMGLHEALQNLIRAQKNAKFTPNIITATPLENSPLELWTLLELVNPSLFNPETFNAFDKHIKAIEKQVVNIRKSRDFPVQEALKVFVEFYRLKIALQKAVIYLTQKEARAKYKVKFPIAQKNDLLVDFRGEAKKIDDMTRRFAKREKVSYFDFLAKINSIITHPAFVGKKLSTISADFKAIEKRINPEEVDQVINESSLLRTLFVSPAFDAIFSQNQRGLLIIDNIAPGELIKLTANQKFGDYTRFYNGKLSEKERDELVTWFKEGEGQPRLLILSIEAGGVGLNLPEADLVVVASKSYNPWQVKQAIDRAFRSGHEGTKPVYRLTYEDSFFSTHLNTIRTIKKLWVKTLFRPQTSLLDEFGLWMKARLAEANRLAINNNKDMTEFNRKMAKLERKVNEVVARVDVDELSGMVKAALPRYPVTQILAIADYDRIPMPYGFSKEDVELFTYAYMVKDEDAKLKYFRETAFQSWNVRKTMKSDCFRKPEDNDLPRYRGHIQNVINRMREMEFLIPPSFEFTVNINHEYECQSWDPNHNVQSSLLLYCGPGPHYEALIRKI